MYKRQPLLLIEENEFKAQEMIALSEGLLETIWVKSYQDIFLTLQTRVLTLRLILLNLEFPSALDLLEKIIKIGGLGEIIVYTYDENISLAEKAFQAGAFSYFHDPIQNEIVHILIEKALKQVTLLEKILSQLKTYHPDILLLTRRVAAVKQTLANRRMKGQYISSLEFISMMPGAIPQKFSEVFHEHVMTQSGTFSKKDKILIVEDEPVLQNQLYAMLNPYYDLLIAGNAREAIDQARQNEKIDLMIINFSLSDMLGTELIPELKTIHPKAVTILMSTYHLNELVVDFLRHKVTDFINQPYDSLYVLTAVSRALQKKELKQILDLLLRQNNVKDLTPR